jgi:hypothetical protein
MLKSLGKKPTYVTNYTRLSDKKIKNMNLGVIKSVWRIRDVYPGSFFLPIPDPGSRIPDPKIATKEMGQF